MNYRTGEMDQVRAYLLDRLAPALEQIRQTVHAWPITELPR